MIVDSWPENAIRFQKGVGTISCPMYEWRKADGRRIDHRLGGSPWSVIEAVRI
jgi:hypothetical protein